MRRKFLFLLLAFVMLMGRSLYADEGMWLLTMLNKTYADMKKQGLKLTAEDIYSINKASLKDAIVIFGGGCTGEMVSSQGLLLTNHHCGYGSIQAASSVEHDYLESGYWAKNKDEEMPTQGLSVTFLVRLEDVTSTINAQLNDKMSEKERADAIQKLGTQISDSVTKNTTYTANVRSFFGGNNFYLLVYQAYKDVRFVGAPPSSIGNYGGETDNWMWPRHTGDFSVFRVYMGKDGKPAAYSKDNIPYVPKHFLPVSLKGVKEGDYTMIVGYPGRTTRYMTSYEIDEQIKITDPNRVKIRAIKQDIMMADMNASEKVKIQYASKWRGSANYYKYAIGEILQIDNNKVIDQKKAIEDKFTAWVNADPKRKAKYGDALNLISSSIQGRKELINASSYYSEALQQAIEIFSISGARGLGSLEKVLDLNTPADQQKAAIDRVKGRIEDFYKDYNPPTDKKEAATMLKLFAQNIDKKYQPSLISDIETNFQGDFSKYVDDLFAKSIFTDKARVDAFLANPTKEALIKDPAFLASKSISDKVAEIRSQSEKFSGDLAKGQRLLIAGLMEMQPEKTFYPDANSTMRLTYGKVQSYEPRDAVIYKYFTTIDGVMQKEDPKNPDFVLPTKLKELYQAKDYGRYGKNGVLNTCFLSNNDITGGNSGSPIMNANGELIGLAFDGNWESMSGNISFEPKLQRTINVDIRYVLFIMDKYAGAKYLVDEMKLAE
jgi:hypothetical protein